MDLWKELEKARCPYNDIENAKKWLAIEIGKLAADIEKLENLYTRLEEEEMKANPNCVKVVCPSCKGYAYEYKNEKKIVCTMCDGKGYIWATKLEN